MKNQSYPNQKSEQNNNNFPKTKALSQMDIKDQQKQVNTYKNYKAIKRKSA